MTTTNQVVYDTARKWFTILPCLVAPVTIFINAPFGKFTPKSSTRLLVDGIKSWIIMELVSPATFAYSFLTSPLSPTTPALSLTSPQTVLALLYITHYLNRAVLSPLRTPSRSKSHIIVPVCATFFNLINGSLMGSYLTSPPARAYLTPSSTYSNPIFYLGLGLWTLGFVGNVVHDEILLNIRRKATAKGKAIEEQQRDIKPTGQNDHGETQRIGEHYAIPHGLLYKYVTYPNYFCEWLEWFGFALAAAPLPLTSLSLPNLSLASLFSNMSPSSILLGPSFAPTLTPPYIFLLSEILLMLPRAYKGHQWYKDKFGDRYPKERKVVVPFVL